MGVPEIPRICLKSAAQGGGVQDPSDHPPVHACGIPGRDRCWGGGGRIPLSAALFTSWFQEPDECDTSRHHQVGARTASQRFSEHDAKTRGLNQTIQGNGSREIPHYHSHTVENLGPILRTNKIKIILTFFYLH